MAFNDETAHKSRINIEPILIARGDNCNRIIPLPNVIQVKQMCTRHINTTNEVPESMRNNSPTSNSNENVIVCDNRNPSISSISITERSNEDNRNLELRENNARAEKFVFRLPGTLMFYVTSLSFITLFPYHDVILFSNYWYELLIPAIFGYLSGMTLLILHQVSKILDESSILNYGLLRMLFAIPSMAVIVTHIAVYFIWSMYFGYYPPMPFIVFILLIPWLLALSCVFCHYFRRTFSDDPLINSKLKFYCFYLLTTCTSVMSCLAIFGMHLIMNKYIQWMNVILLAVSRKTFGSFMSKFICQASVSENTLTVKGISYIQEAVLYKSFIISIISINSNKIVCYLFLGVPFMMNLYLCSQVIKLHGKITNNVNHEESLQLRKEELLMKLIVNEITELLTPVIFVITFVMAYAGPNATIIGNVQNNYWQYHKIEDPFSYISGILFMTVIDFLSAGISLILVWGLYKINCWSFIREKVAALFTIMALNVAFAISGVSNSNISNVQNYDKDNH